MTHVPIVAADRETHLVLEGHIAGVNPHGQLLESQRQALVIFNGPDAYVSPAWYKSQLAVPTWNYITLHARGTLELIHDPSEKDGLLKRLIDQHEPGYTRQWAGLPENYRTKMLEAIVGFRMEVNHLEAKFKLSQNRPAGDRASVYAALASAPDEASQELAHWMQRLGL